MLLLKANNGLLNKLYIFIFYMSFLNSQNCLKIKDMLQLLYYPLEFSGGRIYVQAMEKLQWV